MCMEKKEMLLQIIENFQQQAPHASRTLLEKLDEIKEQLQTMNSEEVEKLDGAVIQTAMDNPNTELNPVQQFFEAYSEMEKVALADAANEQLMSAIRQMRGIFDIPDRYFP